MGLLVLPKMQMIPMAARTPIINCQISGSELGLVGPPADLGRPTPNRSWVSMKIHEIVGRPVLTFLVDVFLQFVVD